MKRVIIIRAKRRNVRLHDKHMLPVGGKPIIAHVIEHALQCKSEAVILSTNCDRMIDVANEYKGAVSCIKRPDSLCEEKDLGEMYRGIDVFHWNAWRKMSGSDDPVLYAGLYGNTMIFDDSLTDRELDELGRYPEDTVMSGVLSSAEDHPYVSMIEDDDGMYKQFLDLDLPSTTQKWPDVVMRSNGPVCYCLPYDFEYEVKYDWDIPVRMVLASKTQMAHVDDRDDYRNACLLYEIHQQSKGIMKDESKVVANVKGKAKSKKT